MVCNKSRFMWLAVLVCGFSLFGLYSNGLAQDQEEPEWVDLFNGEDLTGWIQKNGTATYVVEEGGIICGTTNDGSPNSFLCTEELYGNFILQFEVKVADQLNSGVQIRSKSEETEENGKVKFGRVNGPQVEIEASGKNGAEAGYVYGEAAGGWMTPADQLKPHKIFRDGEWNRYEVIADGPRIRTFINGEPVGDVTHDKIYKTHSSGFIGLQVHSIGRGAGPFQVRWRNLRIHDLDKDVKHQFVAAGRGNGIVMVDESDSIVWKSELPASDVWVLKSGNLLAAIYPCEAFPKGGVCEFDQESKEIVWKYQGQQKEISTVQQIGEDEYLVAELGDQPRAIVINREADVLREMPLQCQKSNAHMQTRMLRLLANGNYLAPHLLDFAVKEYDPKSGEVAKSFATDERGRDKKDWPFSAIRLKNGNTLISCTNGNRVIEVNSDGKIVWEVDNEDLGEELISDACGVQRLPSGNTVITSYHAGKGDVKLFEVTRDKKVVWRYRGLDSGIHHFQILTTNGSEIENPMK